MKLIRQPKPDATSADILTLNAPLVATWLEEFLRDELTRRRGFNKAVIALSGGVDSALVAYLAVKALGRENVVAIRMPYRTSSPESLAHAQLCIDDLGIESKTVDISGAVDGYLKTVPEADATRSGNVMARTRMIVLFDHSAAYKALPIGTGNKTERFFGYFTWHADDSPPLNPIGDLFKTQVWQLARFVGVPEIIVSKPPSADLVVGQTDEADFGVTYEQADRILYYLLRGYNVARMVEIGFKEQDVLVVKRRVETTHWKRHLPTVAMLTNTAINEFYLRPVDY